MTTPERKKNTKILSLADTIDFLTLLKSHDLPYIAKHYSITIRSAQYTRKKYNAYTDQDIDYSITRIQRQMRLITDYPPRDYDKQAVCEHHKNCKAFLSCSCTLRLSEVDIDTMIDILQKRKAYLLSNKPLEILI
jgi:hypothetical protein